MWKIGLVLVCTLAACSGSSSSGGPGAYSPVSVGSMSGKTVTPAGPSLAVASGYVVPTPTTMTVKFDSSSKIELTIPGTPPQTETLTKGSDGNFHSTDGTVSLTVANDIQGLNTNQILYMLSNQTVSGTTTITPLVTGNLTTSANIPVGTTANYLGQMTLYDGSSGSALQPIPLSLSIDFHSTPHVSGSFTFAHQYVSINSAAMTNGAFSTTVQSPDTPGAVTGSIDGQLYGKTGSEVGGTVALQTGTTGSNPAGYVGYYGAAQQ